MPKSNREKLDFDPRITAGLMDLRMFVDNINRAPDIMMRHGIFQQIDKDTVMTKTIDGWEFGYKLEDNGVMLKRKIFVKCEQPLAEVLDEEKDPVVQAVFSVFFDTGQGTPEIEIISDFSLMFTQSVMPLLMVERNPNLVSKGPLI